MERDVPAPPQPRSLNISTILCSVRIVLLLTQVFLAPNAMAGGILLTLAPDGSMLQLPGDFMHSTLFADYF